MEYFEQSKREFSIAIPQKVNKILIDYLIREDGDEDLCFALYNPSIGKERTTALIKEIILPEKGDRQRHGNVSFNSQYFKRVCKIARQAKCGIAFLHSHPCPGWQSMSFDDIAAERRIAPTALSLTRFPLIGLTVGNDGYWSGRISEFINDCYEQKWAKVIRVVGKQLFPYFTNFLDPIPALKKEFSRTVNVWGKNNHANLARLRIGIVGLGSVGSAVAESLARMGLQNFVLIDFDEVQTHNLDRLLGATQNDVGQVKVDVAQRQIRKAATAANISVTTVSNSISEENGYGAALDCDVIFSCVDRPRARNILNHMAYNHLIPVIDGGIKVRMPSGIFEGVDWQLQTVGPQKACLQCLKTYEPSEVSLEIDGKLEDPSYIDTLPDDHNLRSNENIFPFSMNLASLEVLQLIALVTNMGNVSDFGKQRFRYVQGIISRYQNEKCKEGCDFQNSIADGDKYLSLKGIDIAASNARERQNR